MEATACRCLAGGAGRVRPWTSGSALLHGLECLGRGFLLMRCAGPVALLAAFFDAFVIGRDVVGTGLSLPLLLAVTAFYANGSAHWMNGLQVLHGAVRHPMARRYLRFAQALFFLSLAGLLALLDGARGTWCAGWTLVLLVPGLFAGTALALRQVALLTGMRRPVEDAGACLASIAFYAAASMAVVAAALGARSDWSLSAFLVVSLLLPFLVHTVPLWRLGVLARDLRWAIEVGYGEEVGRRARRARPY